MTAGKIACSLLLSLLTLQLPACSFNMNVESMLSPPRLTAEQEQIYQALQNSVGSQQQISLKYPKSGEHLSAFTVADLDGDGTDEAIVFYESSRTSAEENPLRFSLLGQRDGQWICIKEYSTEGAEIDRIDIAKLGTNPRTNLILSYSMVDGADHKVEVLYYRNGELVNKPNFSVPYSRMDLRDLDQDGTTELFIANAAKNDSPAVAIVYSLDEKGNYQPSEVDPDPFTDIARLVYGEIPAETGQNRIPAIYMDCVTGATNVQTVVLSYQNKELKMQYTDSGSGDLQQSERVGSYQTMDIDGDGEPEIPVNRNFYGYTDSSPVQLTNWYVCRGGRLMRKHASYYAAQDGFVFLLPKRWEWQVTAIQENGETVFYTFDPSRSNSDRTPLIQEPLLRLAVETDAVAADAMQNDGYLLLRQQNGRYYLGKTEQGSRKLSVSDSELLFSMQFL